MIGKTILFSLALAWAAFPMGAMASAREVLSLDQGWRFYHGDIAFPVIQGHRASYSHAKAGNAAGAAATDYDDTDWRELDLPHDWAVEGPFDPRENLSQGYRQRGFGWYRKQFKLDPADRGRHLELQFDGVATHCTVWFNGTEVAHNWCGYTSFSVDITPMAQFGDTPNVIAVRVDADAMEGWWYEGAGIYRHTWLIKRDPVHIVTDGVYANPVRDAQGAWNIPLEVTLFNSGNTTARVEVVSVLLDPAGREIARRTTPATVPILTQATAQCSIPVNAPELWSVTAPKLYQLRTTVVRAGKELDSVKTMCGFRTIRFDASQGFFLNGQALKLKGVCNHQDHAGVGVAVPDSLWEFRLRRLKEMGVNAYRCAHGPPAKEFLDACDRLGVLVMDENRNFNPAPEYMHQLEWLVRRDRNHPSVFLWSLFNEEPLQGTGQGKEMARRMAAAVKRLDTTRPVTAAMHGGYFASKNVSQVLDVVGFNYFPDQYDRFHAENPGLPITSSEDTSAFMTRGEYVTDPKHNMVGSYDTERAGWGLTHRQAWRAIATRPFVAGAFIWTGFDYRGEPTPYQWPSASSFFGCLDLCGFPKTAFFLHQAQWVEQRPILTLVPHWNWPGREGQPVKVMALANCDTVALALNGRPLGEKPVDKFEMVSWDVPYQPGKLEAVGKRAGHVVSHFVVETTGEPVALRLTPDRSTLAGDGWDALPVMVEALDTQGRPVPTANLPVEFSISGPGKIIGLGNGDPNCHEPEKGNHRSLFNGLAQVIVQSQRDQAGQIQLRASCGRLQAGDTKIMVEPTAPHPAVVTAQRMYNLQKWSISPAFKERPDPNQEVPENDQNSWASVEAGKLQHFSKGAFVIYRIRFRPFADVRKASGRILFKSITGKAEVWLDGQPVATKETFAAGQLSVKLSPSDREHVLSLLIESEPNETAGLGGGVVVDRE